MTDKKPVKRIESYLKYSGIAIQMGVVILLGTLLGQKLDEKMATQQPYFTIVFALLSIAAGMYIALKDLIKEK